MTMKPVPTLPAGRAVNCCAIPGRIRAKEATLYRKLHEAHCARKAEPGHTCSGRLTIDRNGITLRCPLCGDARRVYETKTPEAS